jgi:FkbM family methyltransferase
MSSLQTAARRAAVLMGRESWLIRRFRPAYEILLDALSGGQGIPWTINSAPFRIAPQYRHQMAADYDAHIAAFLRKRVRPGAVCVNVGANVGVYVLQFARWSEPHGRVIAFEPNPIARAALERHIRLNRLEDRTLVSAAAIGDRCGQAMLFAADADGMSRLGAPNRLIADRATPSPVQLTTLDAFFAAQPLRPDWLFIDIEGFEFAALEGARELIESCGRGLEIIIEIHPDVWDTAGTTRARAEATLAAIGRRPVPLSGQRDPLAEYGLVYLASAGEAVL